MVDFIVKGIIAFGAVYFWAYYLITPLKERIVCGIIGGLSYCLYLLVLKYMSIELATFISCCLVALLAQIMARCQKRVVTLYLIPGIFIFVPGASMYKMAISFASHDLNLASVYLFEAIALAMMIALAIISIESIVNLVLKIGMIVKGGIK